MPRRQGPGYIYVHHWDRFQHYKTGPRGSRPPAWIKLHLDLMGNDRWLALSPEDKVMLLTIWILTARYGHGRVIASLSWLQAQANLPQSGRYRGLQRLSDAGFIRIRASKGIADRYQPDSPEVKKEETDHSKEKEGAAGTARPNGQPAAPKKKRITPLTEDDANWVYPPEWHELQAQRAREKESE